MILTVTPNPCVDKTLFFDSVELGRRLRTAKCTMVPGGKGNNVARAVRAMGYDARPMVIVGGHAGAEVVDLIRHQDGVEPIAVWVNAPTRTVTTVLEESIGRQTALFEPGPAVTPEEFTKIIETFTNVVADAKVVTFNGTVPDSSLRKLYQELLPIAADAGALCLVDSYGPEFALAIDAAAKPKLIKPNVEEASEFVGQTLDSMATRWAAVEQFHQRGIETVVLSMGAEGALVSRNMEKYWVNPPAITEVNPVGSGDALLAGFAIGLHEDMGLESMAKLGVAMGTANALSWDIGHFTQREVREIEAKVTVQRM